MKYDTLLAKSCEAGGEKSLLDHTFDVLDAARVLFGTLSSPTRLGACWSRFFRLPQWEPFSRALEASAIFHDWGKANKGFQDAVRSRGEQAVRHEHLSGLLLALRTVEAKLGKNAEIDWDIVLGAVISHHLKVDDERFAEPRDVAKFLRVYSDHPQFSELLALLPKELGVSVDAADFPGLWGIDETEHAEFD